MNNQNFDPLGFGGRFIQAGMPQMPKTKAVQPQKKPDQGFDFRSLISEGGGTGGALGGAAAGAAIGSVVPGVGTVIGGLVGAGLGGFLGGTGGKLVEDQVIEGKTNIGGALTEGAISGVMGAGPLRLAKLAQGGAAALKAGGAQTLESALVGAVDEPLKTSARGKMLDLGNKALASQYGTIGKNVARATDPADTIGKLAGFGITKPQDAERIAGVISGGDGIINQAVTKAVGNASKVNTSNALNVAKTQINDLGLVDADAKEVLQIVSAKLGSLGKGVADPAKTMQVMRDLEKRIADYSGKGGNYKMSDPRRMEKAKVLGAVRDDLEESLYGAAGANKNLSAVLTPELREQLLALAPKNAKWAQYVDSNVMGAKTVGDLRSATAPFVRINKIINEGDMNSLTMGGRVGNAVGGGGTIGGRLMEIGENLIRDPAARVAGMGLRAASTAGKGPLTAPGQAGIVGRMALTEGGEAGLNVARGTGPTAAMTGFNQEASAAAPQTIESALMGAQPLGGTGMPGMNPLGAQASSGNPYSRENLLSDIQRDPQNADKYIAYYKELDEIFNPAVGGGDFNSNTATQLAMSENGLNTLDQLESLYDQAGGGGGKVGGNVRNFLAGAGFDSNVASYNDLSASAQSQLAKAINGGGQVSDTDALLIANALPKITDSPETARMKLAALRQRLQASRQNMMMYNGGGTLEDTLTQGVL